MQLLLVGRFTAISFRLHRQPLMLEKKIMVFLNQINRFYGQDIVIHKPDSSRGINMNLKDLMRSALLY